MAGHKRKASDEKSDGRRKRESSPDAAQVVEEQKLDFDTYIVDGLNRFARTAYNVYVPFCNKPCAGDATRQAAARVQERFSKMQRIFDEASARLHEQMEGLDDDIEHFVEVSQERDTWWMSGNIPNLPLDEVDIALERHPPRDTVGLTEYLRNILPSEAIQFSESNGITLWKDQKDVIDKALHLIVAFYPLPQGQRYAINAYAEYVDTVLASGTAQYAAYDHVLKDMYGELFVGRHDDEDLRNISTLLGISREKGPDRRRKGHLQPFMEPATAARKLEHAYRSRSKRCPERDRDRQCPHTVMANALELVQEEAYGEVRGKVMLTVGTILPQELAEEVLHYALAAETLPLEIKSYRRDGGLQGFEAEHHCPVLSQKKQDREIEDRMWERLQRSCLRRESRVNAEK